MAAWEAAFDSGRRLLESSAVVCLQVSPSESCKQSGFCLEAYRGGKVYFLVVCGAVLVFILAEDEIAGEILSFPQFTFSLESKALLLVVLPPFGHSGCVEAASSFYMVSPPPPPAPPRVLWPEATSAGPLLLNVLSCTSRWVYFEAINEMKSLRNWSLLGIFPNTSPNT